MPQLNPEFYFSQIFWLVVIFAAIYFFVSKIYIPNIKNAIEGREQKIKDDLLASDKSIENAKKLKSEIDILIGEARHKAFEIVTTATNAAEKEIKLELVKIEKDIAKKLVSEEEKLKRVKAQIVGDLEDVALKLKAEILKVVLADHKSIKIN